jgi:dolichol-phosphate mannosyltransferase
MTTATETQPIDPGRGWATDALVCVVLPTYNEADNLPALTAALLALPITTLQVIVVDDSSPDGTGATADRLAAHHPGRVHVLHRSEERGLGRAYIAGFRLALQLGAQYIIQMDADFSHSPADVPRLLQASEDADLVIGSRYVEGGGLDSDWSWWRRFLSWWANKVWAQLFLGTNVQDATAGFRCWRRATLQGIGLERVRSNGYVFQVEMSYMAERLNYRIVEIPIFFEERRVGRSKMTAGVKFEATWRTVALRWRHRHLAHDGRMRPVSVTTDALLAQGRDPAP